MYHAAGPFVVWSPPRRATVSLRWENGSEPGDRVSNVTNGNLLSEGLTKYVRITRGTDQFNAQKFVSVIEHIRQNDDLSNGLSEGRKISGADKSEGRLGSETCHNYALEISANIVPGLASESFIIKVIDVLKAILGVELRFGGPSATVRYQVLGYGSPEQ
ncbi:hypothetical protein L218DRAFT_988045 [Marasmius fiardii PR-910]|nr:hypothetical protein L218DRAFT_988045 [Marasmius fiardii PR-910]